MAQSVVRVAHTKKALERENAEKEPAKKAKASQSVVSTEAAIPVILVESLIREDDVAISLFSERDLNAAQSPHYTPWSPNPKQAKGESFGTIEADVPFVELWCLEKTEGG